MEMDIEIGSKVFLILSRQFCIRQGTSKEEGRFIEFSCGTDSVEDRGIYPAEVVGIQRTNRLLVLVQTGEGFDECVYMLGNIPGFPGEFVGVNRNDIYSTQQEALEALGEQQ